MHGISLLFSTKSVSWLSHATTNGVEAILMEADTHCGDVNLIIILVRTAGMWISSFRPQYWRMVLAIGGRGDGLILVGEGAYSFPLPLADIEAWFCIDFGEGERSREMVTMMSIPPKRMLVMMAHFGKLLFGASIFVKLSFCLWLYVGAGCWIAWDGRDGDWYVMIKERRTPPVRRTSWRRKEEMVEKKRVILNWGGVLLWVYLIICRRGSWL